MQRFLAGFLAASLAWGGLLYAHATGLVDLGISPELDEPELDADAEAVEDEEPEQTGKRKRRPRARGARKRGPRYSGSSTTGDELGGPETRNLEAAQAGGEEQLLGTEIERGFDSVFSQVRRCLMLAAGEDEVSGKLIFGMRISGASGVTRVNLSGPSSITQGEAGDCLRKAARSISFRRFNGPDMLVHYPVTLQ